MKIDTFAPEALSAAFGIDMSTIDLPGVTGLGAGWGRVRPGRRSAPHQHDEIEMFVIVSGSGEVLVDGAPHPVAPGTVVAFDPFETHVLDNTGTEDLVFVTCYWREAEHAATVAARPGRRRFAERPVFVFSTPPTPNGDLHLGHLSGPYLGADAFVRFQRLTGTRAWHLTGSDDHQSYVVAKAAQEQSTPERTAAHYGAEIAGTLALMDIHPDQFTVTSTDPGYPDGLRDFFAALEASGSVRRRELPALFDADSGRYLYEVDVSGACPSCGVGTNGNICEECGEPNVATDLGRPQGRGSAPVRTGGAERLTLPLHEFRAVVDAHHRLGRVPARLRELAHRVFARPQLDLPLSHPARWGVPPPGLDDQVIWVWPEMAYGFLHGIARLGARLGENWRADQPERDWKIVHFFGYDNSFYHAILYPVLYRLAFPQWQPDIDYHVNEFYLLDQEKFSTSRRHAVWGREILAPETVDAVRFFLARTRPEDERTSFNREEYRATVREVLIEGWQGWLDDLGARLAARFDGIAPDAGIWTPEQTAFLARLDRRLVAVTASLGPDGFSLPAATAELAGIVTDARAFASRAEGLADVAEWQAENRTQMALELAAARLLARVAAPVMPRFATRLAALLGETDASWPTTVELVPAGTKIDLSDQVFFAAEPAAPPPAAEPPRDGVEPPRAVAELPGEDGVEPLPWLADLVRTALGLPATAALGDQTLLELGMSSLQAVALQYQILDRLDVDVPMAELLATPSVAALSRQLVEAVRR